MIQQVCNRGPADAGPGSMCTTTLSQKKKKNQKLIQKLMYCVLHKHKDKGA